METIINNISMEEIQSIKANIQKRYLIVISTFWHCYYFWGKNFNDTSYSLPIKNTASALESVRYLVNRKLRFVMSGFSSNSGSRKTVTLQRENAG